MGAFVTWIKNTSRIFKAVASALVSVSIVGGALLWVNVTAQDRVKKIARDTAAQLIDSAITPLKDRINSIQFTELKTRILLETMATKEVKDAAETKFREDSTRIQEIINSHL